MRFTKKGNVVVLVLFVILVVIVALLMTRESKKVNYEPNEITEKLAVSDISVRKAINKGLKESMENGLSVLEMDDAWFCNRVFPPDIVEANMSISRYSEAAARDFLLEYSSNNYYENLTNISIDVKIPIDYRSLDEDYLRAHSIEFQSGVAEKDLTHIMNNTNEYVIKTRVWYLYENIIDWLFVLEPQLFNWLIQEMSNVPDCQAVNSDCECPDAGSRFLADDVIEGIRMHWEDVDVPSVLERVENHANQHLNPSGIICKAEVDFETSTLGNALQWDYYKGPTNMGIDDETMPDGEAIIPPAICLCQSGPAPPECRQNFLGTSPPTDILGFVDGQRCSDAIAPPGLDSLYARFEYFGMNRELFLDFIVTCQDNSAVKDGDKTFIPDTIVFRIRTYAANECPPPLGAINTYEVCWTMTDENVGPDCEFLMPGAQPPVDPDGVSCSICNNVIRDIMTGEIIGCQDVGATFPTTNPNYFNNNDCQAVLDACLN